MINRKYALAATAAMGALVMSACSSGGDTTPTAGANGGSGDYAGQTLTVMHYEGAESAMAKAWDRAFEIFEEETGATINFQATSFEDINATASQLLDSSDAPDVMEYNKGNGTAGQLASIGLLQDLNDAYAEYGWDSLLAESLQTTTRYDENGIMGSGDYFGVPNYGEFTFLYYNADLFAEYGLEAPTTLAELEAAAQVFVDNGVVPFATSAQEYPLGQMWWQLALSKADRDFVNAYELYTDVVDFNGPEINYATSTVADWVNKGFISSKVTGMTAEDAGVQFINGEAAMFYSGSWWYGRMQTDITSFELGITNWPDTTLSPGSAGNMWVVPTKSKQPELARIFIDITMRPEIQAIIANEGGLPVAANVDDITDEDAQKLIALFNEVNDRDGLSFYPDWPTPTFYGDLNAALQGLVNGSLSVEQTQEQLANDYESYVGNLR